MILARDGLSANDPKRTSAASADSAKCHSLKFCFRLTSNRAKVASAAGFAYTEDDQNERSCHEHPAWMATARRPKVAENAKQVEAANE